MGLGIDELKYHQKYWIALAIQYVFFISIFVISPIAQMALFITSFFLGYYAAIFFEDRTNHKQSIVWLVPCLLFVLNIVFLIGLFVGGGVYSSRKKKKQTN